MKDENSQTFKTVHKHRQKPAQDVVFHSQCTDLPSRRSMRGRKTMSDSCWMLERWLGCDSDTCPAPFTLDSRWPSSCMLCCIWGSRLPTQSTVVRVGLSIGHSWSVWDRILAKVGQCEPEYWPQLVSAGVNIGQSWLTWDQVLPTVSKCGTEYCLQLARLGLTIGHGQSVQDSVLATLHNTVDQWDWVLATQHS